MAKSLAKDSSLKDFTPIKSVKIDRTEHKIRLLTNEKLEKAKKGTSLKSYLNPN